MSDSDGDATVHRAEGRPCPRCGGELNFDPEAQALSCGHCGFSKPVAASGAWNAAQALAERDYASALGDQIRASDAETTQVVQCDSCGAAATLPDQVDADVCPFCAAPLLAGPKPHRHIRPTAVLPFALDQRRAREALDQWLGGRWFAPGDLRDASRRGRPLAGVYMPFWTFDADTRSSYSGRRGDAYDEWRMVPMQRGGQSSMTRQRVRKMRWTRVSGSVRRAFDDVLVIASRALPPRLADRLQRGGFDLFALEPYTPDYLAGFRAEAYAVNLEEGFEAAKATMALAIRRDVKLDIGGDAQRINRIETDHAAVTYKHVLLPVWVAAYRYRDTVYRYVVNGRTGEVIGERPYSWWKIALTAAAAGAAVVAVIALYLASRGGRL